MYENIKETQRRRDAETQEGLVGVVGLWSVGKKEEIHVYMVVRKKD
jgi:hypothetical protein